MKGKHLRKLILKNQMQIKIDNMKVEYGQMLSQFKHGSEQYVKMTMEAAVIGANLLIWNSDGVP